MSDVPLPSARELIEAAEREAADPEHVALRQCLFAARDAINRRYADEDKQELRRLIRAMWGLPQEIRQ